MKNLFIIAVLLGASSCAGVPQSNSIPFSSVESVPFGKATTADIRKRFGEPDEVVRLDRDTAIWSYHSKPQGGLPTSDRLNITMNLTSNRAVGAIWFPEAKDHLSSREAIFSHFSGAGFNRKVVGQVGKDYFSDDEIYTSPEQGISFYLNSVSHTVEHIAVSEPILGQKLSTRE